MVLKEFFVFRKMLIDFNFRFEQVLINVNWEEFQPSHQFKVSFQINNLPLNKLKEEFDSKILAIEEQTEVTLIEMVENRFTLEEPKLLQYDKGVKVHLYGLVEILNERFFVGERYTFIDDNPVLQTELETALIGKNDIRKYLIDVYVSLNFVLRELLSYDEFFTGDSLDTSLPNVEEKKMLNSNIKIKWNGQKKVLTDIFKQLKLITNKEGEPLIPNSYEDIAVFLKNNFDVFSTTELSTIQTTLRSNSLPPNTTNRIIISKD